MGFFLKSHRSIPIKVKTQKPYPFDYKQAPVPPMSDNVKSILQVHHALWNKDTKIEYRNNHFDTFTPLHEGYTSVILPNENGYNFLWITHNLNKSSSGTQEILRARNQGDDTRITWIVDNSNTSFQYIGVIKTSDYYDGQKFIIIERYSLEGTTVIYSTDPSRISRRSSI